MIGSSHSSGLEVRRLLLVIAAMMARNISRAAAGETPSFNRPYIAVLFDVQSRRNVLSE